MVASRMRSSPVFFTSALSMSLEPLERIASFLPLSAARAKRIRIEIEVKIFIHDAVEGGRIVFQPEHADTVGKRLPRDDGKILVTAHQRAQPRVFELLDAPDLRDDVAVARKFLFGDRSHRLDVVERAVGIEDDGLDRHGSFLLFSIARAVLARLVWRLKVCIIDAENSSCGLLSQSHTR